VKAFDAAVLRGGVRSGEEMKYTFVGAPALDAIGGKFSVVGNEAFESVRGLVFKKMKPVLERGGCLVFEAKRNRPNVT
jgi:hypothetical protein